MSNLNVLVGDTIHHLQNFKEGVFDCIICLLPRDPYANSSVPTNHETLGFYYDLLSKEFKRILNPKGSTWLVGKYDPLIYASYFLKERDFYFINHVCIRQSSNDMAASRSLKNTNYMAYWMKPYKHVPHIYNGSDIQELTDVWELEPKEVYKQMIQVSCNKESTILLPFYNHVALNACMTTHPNVFSIKAE